MMRLLALLPFLTQGLAWPDDEVRWLFSCPAEQQLLINELGLSDTKKVDENVLVFVSPRERQFINRIPECVLIEEAQPLATKFGNPTRLEAQNSTSRKLLQNIPAGYTDLAGINQFLELTEHTFPHLAKVMDSGLFPPGFTQQGRRLPLIKITANVDQELDKPRILILSAHHSREIITPVIAMDTIERLTRGYGLDPVITAIVERNEIWVAPQWNPDGYVHCWTVNNMWRKNRRPNTPDPSFGVDQNRNYPYGWSLPCSGSSTPSSDTYKGPSPNSEAETQTLMSMANSLHFAKVLDFHSSGREVLYGSVCTPMSGGVAAFNQAEATRLANLADYVTRLPSGDGQHQGYHMMNLTSYSFLVETEREFQPSYERAKAESARLIPLINSALSLPIPVQGLVFDSETEAPIEALLSVTGFFSQDLNPRYSEPRFGRFHLWLPVGTYTVHVTAPGYHPSAGFLRVVEGESLTWHFPLTLISS
jgi:hypothetical protein